VHPAKDWCWHEILPGAVPKACFGSHQPTLKNYLLPQKKDKLSRKNDHPSSKNSKLSNKNDRLPVKNHGLS